MIYSLLLLSTLVSPRLSALFSLAPLRFMGTVAYGVYLVHSLTGFIFEQALLHFRPESGSVARLLISMLAAIVSVGIAALSWKYFEKPLLTRGHRHQYASSPLDLHLTSVG